MPLSDNLSLLPDNTTGDISPADVRGVFQPVFDSIDDDTDFAGTVTADIATAVTDHEAETDPHTAIEGWHYIGGGGEPSFENSWNSLGVVLGAPGYPLGCYRKRGGFVYLGGYLYGGTLGTTIITLPVGYRPSIATAMPCFVSDFSGNQAFAVVSITTGGAVSVGSPSGWVATGVNTVAASAWVVAAFPPGVNFPLDPPALST